MYEDGSGGYDFIREGDDSSLPSVEVDPRREGSPLGNAVRLVGRNKLVAMAAGVGVLGTGMVAFGMNDGGGVAGVGMGMEAVTAIFVWASARAIATRPSPFANPGPHRIAMAALGLGLLAGVEFVGGSVYTNVLEHNRAAEVQLVGLSPEQQAQTVLVTSTTAGSNSNNEAQAPGNTAVQAPAKEPQITKPVDVPLEVWNKLTPDQQSAAIKQRAVRQNTPTPPIATATRNPDSPSSVRRPVDVPLEVWNKLTPDQQSAAIQQRIGGGSIVTPTVSPEEAQKIADQLAADAQKARDKRIEDSKSAVSKVPVLGPVLGPAADLVSTGIFGPIFVGLATLLAWKVGLNRLRRWRKGQEGKPSLLSRLWGKISKREDGSGVPSRPPREEVDLSGSGGEFFQD